MHSPPPRPRDSHHFLGSSKTAAALRRGDLKISDPVFVDHDTALVSGWEAPSVALIYTDPSRPLPAWSRTTTPLGFSDEPCSTSLSSTDGHASTREAENIYIVQGALPSSPYMAADPTKGGNGLRATIKRVLGSRKQRATSTTGDQSIPHNVVLDQSYHDIISRKSHDVHDVHDAGGEHLTETTSYLRSPVVRPASAKRPAKLTTRPFRRNSLPSSLIPPQSAYIENAPHSASHIERRKSSKSPLGLFGRHPLQMSKSVSALNGAPSSTDDVPSLPHLPFETESHWNANKMQDEDKLSVGKPLDEDCLLNPTPLRIRHRRGPSNVSQIAPFDFAFGEQADPPTSLEERVNTLEIKVFDFEYAIAKLQGHDLPKPDIAAVKSQRPLVQSSSAGPKPQTVPHTSASSPDLSGGLRIPELNFQPAPSVTNAESPSTGTSSKATTIRPWTSRRQSPHREVQRTSSSVRLRNSQYESLLQLIKNEQDARFRMERQIVELQREIEILKAPVFATIHPAAYPTPSPDSFQENALGHRTLHRTYGFHLDRPSHETSRHSAMTPETKTTPEIDTGELPPEVFQTPLETHFTFESASTSPRVGVL